MNLMSAKYNATLLVCAALLYMVVAVGFSSCSSSDVPVVDNDSETTPATMMIFLAADSRSSSDGFEPGAGYENYIDVPANDFRIYFFDSDDNTYIDTFKTIFIPSVSPDNPLVDGGFLFSGYIYPELGTRFKIVVLANWGTYPEENQQSSSSDGDAFVLVKGKTTIRQLTTHASSQFAALSAPDGDASWLGDGRLIPFYGVRSYDLSKTHPTLLDKEGKVLPGRLIDLKAEPVPLIRAMAKVEVILDNPSASFESVEILKCNGKGFSAPFQDSDAWLFDSSDYFSESGGWAGNYIRGVHLVPECPVFSQPLAKVSDRSENPDGTVVPEKWIAYMPEYKNIDAVDVTSLRVRLKRPDDANDAESPSSVGDACYKDIYFAENGDKDGSRFNVERNNVYRFVIRGMSADMDVNVAVQPYSGQNLVFSFGLMRDSRGDLMVIPDENGDYPQYFVDFINDDNPNHKYPQEEDENGNPTTGNDIELRDGDYYAVVVGEYQDMSEAIVWVKDKDGCHVLSNFGSVDAQECSARLVESFFGNNQSERFYKDIFGYRRVHHFDNHNSIVRHPKEDYLLFCMIDNFGQEDMVRKYYEVESWDGDTGWIVSKDDDGRQVGFQKINSDGTLGESVPFS